jgi:hypothetical protein
MAGNKPRVDSGEKILTFCGVFQIAAALQHPFISMEIGSDSPDDSNGKCGMEKKGGTPAGTNIGLKIVAPNNMYAERRKRWN